MRKDIYAEQIIPYLQAYKIILAFASESAIQRTANSFAELGIAKDQMFGIIGQNTQVERLGLDIEHTFVALPECSLAFELRAYHDALECLGEEQQSMIDAFDPERKAIVIGAFWFGLASVAGRRVFGYRHPRWILYEDKCAVSFIWNKAGILQAKSTVVSVSSLHAGLPEGWTYPVVLSGDSLNGITGGGSHVRCVLSEKQLEAILSFFESDCESVRLMEYIEGISCSMHGFVLEDAVCTSIPIEMVVLPRADGQFVYMGAATHWEPSLSERMYLEETVRKVGVALREEADFRGTFTIDGILKDGLFYPTEINTRAGAGIFALYHVHHSMYYLLDLMIKDGQLLNVDASELEEWMHKTAEQNRSTRAWGGAHIDGLCPNETHFLRFSQGAWIQEKEASSSTTTLNISEGRDGAFLMLSIAKEALSIGEPLFPYVKAAMQYCDERWKTKFLNCE